MMLSSFAYDVIASTVRAEANKLENARQERTLLILLRPGLARRSAPLDRPPCQPKNDSRSSSTSPRRTRTQSNKLVRSRPHPLSCCAESSFGRSPLSLFRSLAFQAGAGQIGAYQNVSFTTPGNSEFTPAANAKPAVGTPGVAEQVDEVRVEITAVGRDVVRRAVDGVRKVHPYEEVVVDVVRLEDF